MTKEEFEGLILCRAKMFSRAVLSPELLERVEVSSSEVEHLADRAFQVFEVMLRPYAGVHQAVVREGDTEIQARYHVCPHAAWDEDEKHLTFMRAHIEPMFPDPDLGICQRLATALDVIMGDGVRRCYCDEIRRGSPNDFKPCAFCEARAALKHAKQLGLEVKGECDAEG